MTERKPPHPLMPWILGPDHAPEPAPPLPTYSRIFIPDEVTGGTLHAMSGAILATGPEAVASVLAATDAAGTFRLPSAGTPPGAVPVADVIEGSLKVTWAPESRPVPPLEPGRI